MATSLLVRFSPGGSDPLLPLRSDDEVNSLAHMAVDAGVLIVRAIGCRSDALGS